MSALAGKVVIIGGGPAGLSCAIWLKQLGADVLLLEASERLGGLQNYSPYTNLWVPGVQNRTGQEIAANLAHHAMDLGISIRTQCVVENIQAHAQHFTLKTLQGEEQARLLVIATGSVPCSGDFTSGPHVAIGPGMPMEKLEVKDQRVAIFGGGDNAFDQAHFVRERGAREIVIHTRSTPRAQRILQQRVAEIPVVIGNVSIDQQQLRVNGRAFDAFGVMYGFEAQTPPGLKLAKKDGYLVVDRNGRTDHTHVYACGDVTNYLHPCVSTACAHGAHVAKQVAMVLESA